MQECCMSVMSELRTPQKSGIDAQLQQHPLLFWRRVLYFVFCLCFIFVHSYFFFIWALLLFLLSFCSVPLFSHLFFLILPSSLLSPSLFLSPPLSVGAASHRETDWNRCLRGRQDMCVCVCVCACTASTIWLIGDMRTTAASHRWGRGKRGRAGATGRAREIERKKESGRDGEKWGEKKRKEGERRGERE